MPRIRKLKGLSGPTVKDKSVPLPLPSGVSTPVDTPTIIIDTREPKFQAYDFTAYNPDVQPRREKLSEGDYSISGLVGVVAVERKTLDDFVQSITQDRFWAELARARGYARFSIVIESGMSAAERGEYQSKISPIAIMGAVYTIGSTYGYPVIWAGSRQSAARWVYEHLIRCWEKRDTFSQIHPPVAYSMGTTRKSDKTDG